MAEPRKIHVTLTANVDDYIAGMERAAKATLKVTRARRGLHAASLYIGGLIGVPVGVASMVTVQMVAASLAQR